ncbi:MAG TPA: NAD-dependent succinate-semialdehyde dehydrogenase [Iamia sp.]|nr:NAD-dependent succinate-semialdehyde dehydrogenase [Iamia sp.]
MTDHDILLHIDGTWRPASGDRRLAVVDPATGDTIGSVPVAEAADLDEALAAAERGFAAWRSTSAHERSKVMRRAAALLRDRAEEVSRLMTLEQGKPLAQAAGEVAGGAETIEWMAEEGRRAYGRLVPSRDDAVQQMVVRQPVGPVAAFTPWNFPINQVVRKVSAALATGCSIIVKAPEETPASPAALVGCFVDAGLPDGVLQLVYGVPAEVSGHLIPHPTIRKVTFTGSTAVGKQLAALAGQHMKRTTMELGGHAPVLVFDDVDAHATAAMLAATKVRNAGQVCVSPTRILVQRSAHDEFLDTFVDTMAATRVGSGLDPETQMGPLANERRIPAIEALIDDAQAKGGKVVTGGHRLDGPGWFYEPTVITGATPDMRIMNEEPFGPVAVVSAFDDVDEAITEANRLPYGLAAYAFTRSAATTHAVAQGVEAGMIGINHMGIGAPEVPFGGVKDSGHGSEGGTEALDGYLDTKLVSISHRA